MCYLMKTLGKPILIKLYVIFHNNFPFAPRLCTVNQTGKRSLWKAGVADGRILRWRLAGGEAGRGLCRAFRFRTPRPPGWEAGLQRTRHEGAIWHWALPGDS